jgi:hypothetical protein
MGLSHALETRYRRRSIRGRPLYEGRERADIHHGPESTTPIKAEYIGADQLSSLIFACNSAADHTSGNATSMIGLCQEGKSSPDAGFSPWSTISSESQGNVSVFEVRFNPVPPNAS